MPLLFVLIPTAYQVDPALRAELAADFRLPESAVDWEQPNRRLGESLRSAGLSVVDPLPAFRTWHGHGERLYGAIDSHLNRHGHRRLAELVLPDVERLLGL